MVGLLVSASNLTTSRSQLPPTALPQPLKPSAVDGVTASFGVLACFPSLSAPLYHGGLPPATPLHSDIFCALLNVVSLVSRRLRSSTNERVRRTVVATMIRHTCSVQLTPSD